MSDEPKAKRVQLLNLRNEQIDLKNNTLVIELNKKLGRTNKQQQVLEKI